MKTLFQQYQEIDWSAIYPDDSTVQLTMKDFRVLKALADAAIAPQWAVMIGIAPKFTSYEPLAYGFGSDPEPQMLLRRHRIEPFPSKEAAEDALKETLQIGRKINAPWTKWRFKIVEIVSRSRGHVAKTCRTWRRCG